MDVQEGQSRRLAAILAEFDISFLVAFGSRVRGAARPDSDMDLGVMFRGTPRVLEVRFELQEVFPSVEVDLAVLNRADPLFLEQVNRSCRLLSGSEERYREFRRLAFHRYQDFRPYLKMEAETNRRRLEALV